jgi:hypothetical protein
MVKRSGLGYLSNTAAKAKQNVRIVDLPPLKDGLGTHGMFLVATRAITAHEEILSPYNNGDPAVAQVCVGCSIFSQLPLPCLTRAMSHSRAGWLLEVGFVEHAHAHGVSPAAVIFSGAGAGARSTATEASGRRSPPTNPDAGDSK